MTTSEFDTAIANGRTEFKDIVFDSDIRIYYLHFPTENQLIFVNCIFNETLEIDSINDPKLAISFNKCIFKKTNNISFCTLKSLIFFKVNEHLKLEIFESEFESLSIDSNGPIIASIGIDNTIVTQFISCRRLNINEGNFAINLNNNFPEKLKNLRCNFRDSKFDTVNFSGNFGFKADFGNFEARSSTFDNCIFNKSNFGEANFGTSSLFLGCTFHSDMSFRNSINESELQFFNCTFENFCYFDGSKFKNLEITQTTFEKKSSFDRLELDTILLNQSTFSQGAFFDEIKILSLNRCNRKSIRAIKQELQKAENKIDYNRFRAYELHAYYRELNWQWKDGFKDKLILGATILFTGFENSWRRALCITLLFAAAFYSLFFISENYMFSIDFSQWQEFLSGYFRFLIVTDFYNPLSEGRTYIDNTNTIGWFIFILGKIVIAVGIYEMIQAFRKFKA